MAEEDSVTLDAITATVAENNHKETVGVNVDDTTSAFGGEVTT